MRIHGYCTECRRIKQVSGHGMAMMGAGGVAQGVCSDCEEDREFRRGTRVRNRQTGVFGVVMSDARHGRCAVRWEEDEHGEQGREYVYTRHLSRR
jgi:hypothetical protein